MKRFPVVLAVMAAFLMSACASKPATPPTVIDAEMGTDRVSPGESFLVTFVLEVTDPTEVDRVHVRGLPQNTLAAGTNPDLALPSSGRTPYTSELRVVAPAADGRYNLELVVVVSGQNFVVPLGSLTITDIPSRILYAKFSPSSHEADDCQLSTRLVTLEYAVADGNGANDFTGAALTAANPAARDLVFFPRWEPIAWAGGEPGIVVDRPTDGEVTEERVASDIRIHCDLPINSVYEFALWGQNISRLDGRSMRIESESVSYVVK